MNAPLLLHYAHGVTSEVPEEHVVQRIGSIAVHHAWHPDKPFDLDLDLFTCTHIPTGFAIGEHMRKTLALAQAAAFSAFDLSRIREPADLKAHPQFEHLKLIRDTFAAVEHEWDSLEYAAGYPYPETAKESA